MTVHGLEREESEGGVPSSLVPVLERLRALARERDRLAFENRILRAELTAAHEQLGLAESGWERGRRALEEGEEILAARERVVDVSDFQERAIQRYVDRLEQRVRFLEARRASQRANGARLNQPA